MNGPPDQESTLAGLFVKVLALLLSADCSPCSCFGKLFRCPFRDVGSIDEFVRHRRNAFEPLDHFRSDGVTQFSTHGSGHSHMLHPELPF